MKKQPTQNIAKEYGITGKDGAPLEIPVKGSMGLLATGYRGLMAWRAKRIAVGNIKENQPKAKSPAKKKK
jgi:hypothetical protein